MLLRTNSRLKSAISSPRLIRTYHSYPDPSEKPIISSNVSNQKKLMSKVGIEFDQMKRFSMENVFKGVPVSTGIKDTSLPPTEMSKLANGLTLASQDTPGLMSSFALIVGVGSSFEIQSGITTNTGVTHIIEQSAFRSTFRRSHDEMIKEIEQLGGMVQCIASRENIMFCIDVIRVNSEQALDILADAVLNARISPEEIIESGHIMRLQADVMPSELVSRDAVQRAGYIGTPLGQHHYCPSESVDLLDATKVHSFRSQHLFGENCVLSAVGVDHATLSRIASAKFATLPSMGGLVTPRSPRVLSKYTGGLVKNERELKEPFSRLGLGFEIGGWFDPDLVTACLLQQLLGGGSSFSAGGPGKGMYSRLYREVLNRNHWIEAAESFVSIHDESGIFGIDGACEAADLPGLFRTFLDQLLRLSIEHVQPIELSRAKNMLKSMLLMQLESRLILCEDIAKQTITYKKRDSPLVLCEKIDAVTAKDIMNFAMKMLQSDPAVGCAGVNLSSIPEYEQLKAFTRQYKQQVWSSKSIAQ